jgi:membrane associated rhomboid family serine protease
MIPLRDTQPSDSKPVMTVLLIVVNFVVFFYEISLDPFSRNHLIEVYGLVPDRLIPMTLITSMFLHGGWLHVIGNMWFLWIFGDNIEDILGRGKYLLFYLLCGVAAALAQVAVSPDSRIPTIGASGAIAGVMGAYLVKFPRSRVLTLVPVFIVLTTFELPAAVILVYWFVIQFFSGVGSIAYSRLSEGGVAWFAHVGGFLTGILLIYLFPTRKPYRRRYDLHW